MADLGPAHFLVLNKFAVVPEHFILATTEFKPQTHILESSDLEATLACIEAYEDARRTTPEKGARDGEQAVGMACTLSSTAESILVQASPIDTSSYFLLRG